MRRCVSSLWVSGIRLHIHRVTLSWSRYPRRIRTITHVLPDEDLSKAPLFVRDCIGCYTSDYSFVEYKFRAYSASSWTRERVAERLERLLAGPRHQYEVDADPLILANDDLASQHWESQPSSGRVSVASSSSSCVEGAARGSWASLELRASCSDPLLPALLDDGAALRRMENREADLMGLYLPYLDEEEAVERRLAADAPADACPQRLLVVCHHLKFELDVEPLFASMALYDAKEKRKLSENFYFNMNSDCTRQMIASHVGPAALSTLSRSAVFEVPQPSPDIFLVIRVEKVLQGDVNECVEPYIKDDKVIVFTFKQFYI
ncbi:hypothetical protein ACJJTC_004561 [Scirpophaga incertulas]